MVDLRETLIFYSILLGNNLVYDQYQKRTLNIIIYAFLF